MRRSILAVLLFCAGLFCLSQQPRALTSTQMAVLFSGNSCAQSNAAIARLDGSQGTANAAYATFICNLVREGVWAKLDVAVMFAANDSANSLINLVGNYANPTTHGSPTFAAKAGYTGTDTNTASNYLDSNFNATTATCGGSCKFAQNSAHFSLWAMNNFATVTGGSAGGIIINSTYETDIHPRFSDGKAYYRANDGATSTSGVTTATSQGHYVSTRSGASAQNGYKNGIDQGVVAVTSGALQNLDFFYLGENANGTGGSGYGGQIAAVTLGGALTAGDALNLCHETNVYLTTIAGVAPGTC